MYIQPIKQNTLCGIFLHNYSMYPNCVFASNSPSIFSFDTCCQIYLPNSKLSGKDNVVEKEKFFKYLKSIPFFVGFFLGGGVCLFFQFHMIDFSPELLIRYLIHF